MVATQGTLKGLYVPTTNIWDVPNLSDRELLVRLYQNVNLISTVLNLKESGYYDTQEFITGQSYFPNPALNSSSGTVATYRPVYRLTVNTGALPNATTKQIPHGLTINSGFTWVNIYGSATDPATPLGIPLPYSSVTDSAHNVEVYVDGTYINIITGTNRSNFTRSQIVLEYMKF